MVEVILGFSSPLVRDYVSESQAASGVPEVVYNKCGMGELEFLYDWSMESFPAVVVKDQARMDFKTLEKIGKIRGKVGIDMDVLICPGQEKESYVMGKISDLDNVIKTICRELARDQCVVTVEVKYLKKIISFQGRYEESYESDFADMSTGFLPTETLMELISHKIKKDSFQAGVRLEFKEE